MDDRFLGFHNIQLFMTGNKERIASGFIKVVKNGEKKELSLDVKNNEEVIELGWKLAKLIAKENGYKVEEGE